MKATVIKYLRERRMRKLATEVSKSAEGDIPLTRTTSRAASVHESMYSNRVSFIRRAAKKVTGLGGHVKMSGMSFIPTIPCVRCTSCDTTGEELRRFSSIQAAQTGQTLARHPSRPQ